jgi:ketosteroid isomerase-like protein
MKPPDDLRDLLHALLEALNARDFDAVADLIEPDHELRSLLAETEGELYIGLDGLRRWAEGIDATWSDHRVELVEIRETGPDEAALVIRNLGVAKLSGVPLDTLRGMVVTRRHGRVSRSAVYATPAEAFRAVGLEA